MSAGNAAFSRLEFATFKAFSVNVPSGTSATLLSVPSGKVFIGLSLNVVFYGGTTTNLITLQRNNGTSSWKVWGAYPAGSGSENIQGLTGPLVVQENESLTAQSTNGGFDLTISGFFLPQNVNAG